MYWLTSAAYIDNLSDKLRPLNELSLCYCFIRKKHFIGNREMIWTTLYSLSTGTQVGRSSGNRTPSIQRRQNIGQKKQKQAILLVCFAT